MQYEEDDPLGSLSATHAVKEEQDLAVVTGGDPMCLLQQLRIVAQQLRVCQSLS